MDEADRFGAWVKRARKALDLSQKDLADQVGCAVVTIQKIEEGQRRPSRQISELLCRALDIAPDETERFLKLARGLAGDTAPLPPPGNLPAPPAPFIGRVEETSALRQLLLDPRARLVTLVGPPGVGKTRLAIEAASSPMRATGSTSPAFPDGVWFVPLAPLQDPALVLPTLARVLNIRYLSTDDPVERLAALLRDRSLLLVLDNWEHLLPASPQMGALLSACRGLKLLATSRVPLELYGETIFRVEPLRLPPRSEEGDGTDPKILLEYESVMMFVERARAVRPEFALSSANEAQVVQLCRWLEGLPLGIELASAGLYRSNLPELLAQVESAQGPLRGLKNSPQDFDDRQRSLQNAIAWSYHLLSQPEQAVYRGLGVFRGGISPLAAETVVVLSNEGDAGSVSAGLRTLTRHNLVQAAPSPDGGTRYTMLELIQADALDRCARSGELERLRDRHANWFLAEMTRLAQETDQDTFLAQAQLENDNMRAALGWLHEQGDALRMLQLCTALRYHWEFSGYQLEAKGWLANTLALPGDVPVVLRAQALLDGCVLSFQQGDYSTAQSWGEESLRLFEAAGHTGRRALALLTLGRIAIEQGQYAAAEEWEQSALALYRSIEDPRGMAGALSHLAEVYLGQEDYPAAKRAAESSLALTASLGGDFWDVLSYVALCEVTLHAGQPDQARDHLLAGLERGLAFKAIRMITLVLAFVAARACHVNTSPHHAKQAAYLWGAVTTIRETRGLAFSAGHQRRLEVLMAPARAALGPAGWQAAEQPGRRLSLEAAVDLAREVLSLPS